VSQSSPQCVTVLPALCHSLAHTVSQSCPHCVTV